jgi:PAS domain S-box-containing protein
MDIAVVLKNKSKKDIVTTPAKYSLPSSAFLFFSEVLLIIMIAAAVFLLGKLALFIVLVTMCLLISLVLIMKHRKNLFGGGRFKMLFESSSNPMLITDGSGVTHYANPAFLRWSGMDGMAIRGQNIFDRMISINAKGKEENVWTDANGTLSSGQVWIGEVKLIRSDGRMAVAELNLSPVLDSKNKLVECIALHRDLAEKKEFTQKMIETQHLYSSIVDSSLDAILVVQDEHLMFANPSAITMFGYTSSEDMKSFSLSETIAPQSKPYLTITPDGRAIGEEVFRNFELRGLTKQGKIIDLEANANVVAWNGHPAVQVSFRNITKRKMLEREQALWLWEQETLSDIDRKLVGVVELNKIFAAILQQTLNLIRAHVGGILLFDETQLNVQWISICGNTLQHTAEMFPPGETMRKILKNKEPQIIQSTGTDTHYPLSQLSLIGEEKLVSSAWLPLIVEGKQKGMLVVGYRQYHDFTGREMRLLISLAEKNSIAMVNAQLYTDLLQREKELEILSGARVQAQEDERRRIAREIHDGLGQMLTAIKFNLEILEDMITIGKDERERIDDMKNLLDSVMKEAREISYNLMPSVLDDFGLAPALQLLSEQFSNRTNVKVQFQAHGITDRLDSNLEIGLYRIAQESLNNVSKHAEATEVNVQIIRHSNGVRLVIEDNGKGITNQPNIIRATGKGGMGLPGIRERASSIGGALTIDSTPHHGTLITVEVPFIKSNTHE